MHDDTPLGRWLWPLLASLAGAITALSFRPYKTMNKWEIVLALFVGASFAFFVAPTVVMAMYGKEPIDIRVTGAVFYLMASGQQILIPLAIKKLGQMFGYREPEQKP